MIFLALTSASSPSVATRGDLFVLLRAVCLAFSQTSLARLWPLLDVGLRILFDDMAKTTDAMLSDYSRLQGAKLLDLLLCTKPDEFQLYEWLFVTDTIDAVYPSASTRPIAAADQLVISADGSELQAASQQSARRPWLCNEQSREPKQPRKVLESFFAQLSIRAFEDVYSLESSNIDACREDLLADIFTNIE